MTDHQPKKRILFTLPALTPGGAERVMIGLMNKLDRKIYDPALLVVYDHNAALRGLVDPAIPVIDLHHRGHIGLSLVKVFQSIRAQRPDIIVSTMAPMNFAVLMLRPFLGSCKVIVREAITPSFFLQRHKVLAPAVKLAYQLLYPLAACVVSPAQLIFMEFEKALGMRLRAAAWLPNPVDEDKLRGFGIVPNQNGGVRFVAAGRLHHQKGFDRLISALKGFDPGHEWHLTILGDGEEHAKLQKLIEECGLKGRITLPGHVGCPWPMIAGADVFLLPSRWEGLPNVVLESLSCGAAVIAVKDAGGIAEIANLAPESVIVVDDVATMVEMMRTVPALHVKQMRPSLLPEIFRQDAVNARFVEILGTV